MDPEGQCQGLIRVVFSTGKDQVLFRESNIILSWYPVSQNIHLIHVEKYVKVEIALSFGQTPYNFDLP